MMIRQAAGVAILGVLGCGLGWLLYLLDVWWYVVFVLGGEVVVFLLVAVVVYAMNLIEG